LEISREERMFQGVKCGSGGERGRGTTFSEVGEHASKGRKNGGDPERITDGGEEINGSLGGTWVLRRDETGYAVRAREDGKQQKRSVWKQKRTF